MVKTNDDENKNINNNNNNNNAARKLKSKRYLPPHPTESVMSRFILPKQQRQEAMCGAETEPATALYFPSHSFSLSPANALPLLDDLSFPQQVYSGDINDCTDRGSSVRGSRSNVKVGGKLIRKLKNKKNKRLSLDCKTVHVLKFDRKRHFSLPLYHFPQLLTPLTAHGLLSTFDNYLLPQGLVWSAAATPITYSFSYPYGKVNNTDNGFDNPKNKREVNCITTIAFDITKKSKKIKYCNNDNTSFLYIPKKTNTRFFLKLTNRNGAKIINCIHELIKRCQLKLKKQNIILNNRFTALDFSKDDCDYKNQMNSRDFISFFDEAKLYDKDTYLHISMFNLSNNRIEFDGIKVLAESLKFFKNLTELNLSCSSYKEKGFDIIANELSSHRCFIENLTLLDLSGNNITGAGAAVIAAAISQLKSLTILRFYKNKLRDEGAIALANALSSHYSIRSLTELDLTGIEITYKGAVAIADVLPYHKSLIGLYLGGYYVDDHITYCNNIGAEGAKALAKALTSLNSLTTIALDGNNIGDEGIKALAYSLPSLACLSVLLLNGNSIKDEGAKALASALSSLTSLTKLHLDDNNIGDEGIKALACSLPSLTSLTALFLHENEIGDEGAKAIANALPSLTSLTKLNLRYNRIQYEGAKDLVIALLQVVNLTELCKFKMTQVEIVNILKELDELPEKEQQEEKKEAYNDLINPPNSKISSFDRLCLISRHGLRRIVTKISIHSENIFEKLINDEGVVKICKALNNCDNLAILRLTHNKLTASMAGAIAVVLPQLKKLTCLHLGVNSISDRGAFAIAGVLPSLGSLRELDLQANNIGDEGAKVVANALPSLISLTELSLNVNNIGDEGAKAIAKVLGYLTSLRLLCLNDNNIGDEGTIAISIALPHADKLTKLWLHHNSITNKGKSAVEIVPAVVNEKIEVYW